MTGFVTDSESPSYESSRLAALERYAVLDTAAEAIFDQFAAMTAQFLNAPISIVGMIDAERHWFKAAYGTTAHSNSRAQSFCTYTVESNQVFTVGNASDDPRFANNPNVAGGALIRAYAGAPLVTSDGLSIGTLCIFDTKPREFTLSEGEILSRLASLVMRELEERLARIDGRIHAGSDTPESREQALDRAASHIGQRLGLPVKSLYGSRADVELGALSSESELLEGIFAKTSEAQLEAGPNPSLKLKMLERVRFAQRHGRKPAPARAILITDRQVVVAHALEPDLPLTLWAKRSGEPAVAIADFSGSAVMAALPADSSLIGLSRQSSVSEPDWLALGALKEI
jgi:GAF domain-containing protein